MRSTRSPLAMAWVFILVAVGRRRRKVGYAATGRHLLGDFIQTGDVVCIKAPKSESRHTTELQTRGLEVLLVYFQAFWQCVRCVFSVVPQQRYHERETFRFQALCWVLMLVAGGSDSFIARSRFGVNTLALFALYACSISTSFRLTTNRISTNVRHIVASP